MQWRIASRMPARTWVGSGSASPVRRRATSLPMRRAAARRKRPEPQARPQTVRLRRDVSFSAVVETHYSARVGVEEAAVQRFEAKDRAAFGQHLEGDPQAAPEVVVAVAAAPLLGQVAQTGDGVVAGVDDLRVRGGVLGEQQLALFGDQQE